MARFEDDPFEAMMKNTIEGFKHTTQAIQDLRAKHEKLEQKLERKLQEQAQAAYDGMTASGKSRFTARLVEIEEKTDKKGAKARVAETLNVSPARISQLLRSEKNRKNGK
jgi:hypothetical protein